MSRLITYSLGLIVIVTISIIDTGSANESGRLSGGELGDYRYYYYEPVFHDAQRPLPLVVVLHGCKQDAADIAKGTRFNALADEGRFIVLYPETEAALTNPYGCWLWWRPDHQRRNSGEPQLIVQMVELLKNRVKIDPDRVYVTGISSGGAMSTILASVYPDVFAAAGVHSGMAYGAASSAVCGLGVMRHGFADPQGHGDLAYHHQGDRHRMVPAILFQGTGDSVVSRVNTDQLVEQLAQMNDLADDGDGQNESFDDAVDDTETARVDGGYEYAVYKYRDNIDRVVLQKVLVDRLEHAWSGGSEEGSYTDPKGPDATAMMWDFFRQWSLKDTPLVQRPAVPCREKQAPNFLHFWWHHTMSWGEFLCAPWSISWRYSFDGIWGGGRCP